jgi:endonuclease YncB( thermonuclease family)
VAIAQSLFVFRRQHSLDSRTKEVTKTHAVKIFAAITVMLCLPLLTCAATLQAKVVEVESGNTLVVTNINRPLRIRLKAVVPPEVGQPFSEAAREHLKALVLDKAVAVEYTHLADGYLEAKVILNGIDIGSQMLRDGVAWYDHASDYELRESDRNLYAQCEQAARNEKRGLWQDQSPVAPWEFRRVQLAKLNGIVTDPSFRQSQSRKLRANQSLSNDDLLGAMMGPGPMSGQPNFKQIANGAPGRWTRYESVADHFSVLIPSNGAEATSSALDTEGNAIPFHYLAANDDQALYLLMSSKGANGKYTDASAADETVKGFVGGLNHGFERAGLNITVTIKPQRELKLSGYAGRQYSLSGQGFSGVVRVFSKQLGNEREFFMLCVLTRPGSESSGDQFLNSFKINGN